MTCHDPVAVWPPGIMHFGAVGHSPARGASPLAGGGGDRRPVCASILRRRSAAVHPGRGLLEDAAVAVDENAKATTRLEKRQPKPPRVRGDALLAQRRERPVPQGM